MLLGSVLSGGPRSLGLSLVLPSGCQGQLGTAPSVCWFVSAGDLPGRTWDEAMHIPPPLTVGVPATIPMTDALDGELPGGRRQWCHVRAVQRAGRAAPCGLDVAAMRLPPPTAAPLSAAPAAPRRAPSRLQGQRVRRPALGGTHSLPVLAGARGGRQEPRAPPWTAAEGPPRARRAQGASHGSLFSAWARSMARGPGDTLCVLTC